MTNVVQGPFSENKHTGPQEDNDPGFVAKLSMSDLEGDAIHLAFVDKDEVHIDTMDFTYLSFSRECLYQILDFMDESEERYLKWKRSKAGKAWLKRNSD